MSSGFTTSNISEPPTSIPGVDAFAHFVIERYEDGRLAKLGAGAMGITYRAFDTKLERSVALKLIHPQYVDDAGIRSRFAREAKAAARLQHPNIASVLFQGEEGNACFYVMELVNGENLHSFVQRSGPLPPILALKISQQIALALAVAAKEGIIHRDLKPGNIMLVSYHEGRDPDAKVIDFGLAKLMVESNATQLSTAGFIGTPEFASPEQCEEKPLDERSDLYSLGATLWFMLTGQPLFIGSMLSIVKAHVSVPPPFETLRGAPHVLVKILARLLAKNPVDRPANGVIAADEIENAIKALSSDPSNYYPLSCEEFFGSGLPPAARVVIPPAVTSVRTLTRRASSGGTPQAAPTNPPRTGPPLIAWAISGMAFFLAASVGMAILVWKPKPVGRLLPTTTSTPTPATSTEPPPVGNLNPPTGPPHGLETAGRTPAKTLQGALGWQYVEVNYNRPQTGTVLVATKEVTVKDFEQFVKATGHQAAGDWRNPGFVQTSNDPVVNVSPADALKFCEWLTKLEAEKGVLPENQIVRLPARYEYDALAGPAPNERPPEGWDAARGGGGKPPPPYLWGFTWPPPFRSGNFADETAVKAGVVPSGIAGYEDGFAHTAPVGSMAPNYLGLFDIEGNVREWDHEPRRGEGAGVVGASFLTFEKDDLRTHREFRANLKTIASDAGFRCVIGPSQ